MFFSHFCHNHHQNYQNYHHNYHCNHHYHHQKKISVIRAKRRFWRPKKEDQVARIGVRGGGFRWFGQCPKENVFFLLMSSLIFPFLLLLSWTIWAQTFIYVGVYFIWMEFCVKNRTNFIFGVKLCMTLIFPNELWLPLNVKQLIKYASNKIKLRL